MNKCKECMYGERFRDMFTGKIRYRCGINQMKYDSFGDGYLIIDGECDKYRNLDEEVEIFRKINNQKSIS